MRQSGMDIRVQFGYNTSQKVVYDSFHQWLLQSNFRLLISKVSIADHPYLHVKNQTSSTQKILNFIFLIYHMLPSNNNNWVHTLTLPIQLLKKCPQEFTCKRAQKNNCAQDIAIETFPAFRKSRLTSEHILFN